MILILYFFDMKSLNEITVNVEFEWNGMKYFNASNFIHNTNWSVDINTQERLQINEV